MLSLHSSSERGEFLQWPRHDDSIINIVRPISISKLMVTFRVSGGPQEMYCGQARLCVCVSICLFVCPRPHAHTIARTRM